MLEFSRNARKTHFRDVNCQTVSKKMNAVCALVVLILFSHVDSVTADDNVGYTNILQKSLGVHQYVQEANKPTEENYLELNSKHNVLSRAEEILFNEVGANGSSYDVSSTCLNHTKIYLEALVQRKLWALKSKTLNNS
jgi:hypothetical protein